MKQLKELFAKHDPQLVSFKPLSFNEAKVIVEEIQKGNAVRIDFTETPNNISLRIVDFISGVLVVTNGDYRKLSSKQYLISKSSKISEKFAKELI